MLIKSIKSFALIVISAVTAFAQGSGPFLLAGERVNRGLPAPIFTLYDETNRQMAIAQNGEVRWFDADLRKPPIRTAKITEVPKAVLTAEQAALAEEAKRFHQATFGDLPENFCSGCELYQRPGSREFVLTDRDRQVFFYSTATGALLRKFEIKKPAQKFAPGAFAISDDGKTVLTENTDLRKAYLHNLATGEKLFEIDKGFFDSVGLSTDGTTVFFIQGNILSRYSVATGKKATADFTIKADSAGIIRVSPDGQRIAFNLYNKAMANAGQAIFELETQKLMVADPTLAHCAVSVFTPDGKFLAVHTPRYLHFVDTSTGKHSFTYSSGYPDIWDAVIDPSISPDSTKISFRPAGGIDVNAPYFVFADLSQPRERMVTKLK